MALFLLQPRRSAAFLLQQHRSMSTQLAGRCYGSFGSVAVQATGYGLMDSVKVIKGVGKVTQDQLDKLGIRSVFDLLLHRPEKLNDWRKRTLVKDAKEGEPVTMVVQVKSITKAFSSSKGKQTPTVVHCVDEEDSAIDLLFFLRGDTPPWFQHSWATGNKRVVRGVVKSGRSVPQILHPETPRQFDAAVEAVYPLTNGLTNAKLRETIEEALQNLNEVPDWLDENLRADKGWPSFIEALHTVHHPLSLEDLKDCAKAVERLAFDELLATQLLFALQRRREQLGLVKQDMVRPIRGSGDLIDRCIANLPFELTPSQRHCVDEIWEDLASENRRMVRLLQGDVGSGKTVCALLAMLRAVEAGCQATMMVPTEVLAHQHITTFQALTNGLTVTTPEGLTRPLRVEVLSSGLKKGKARKALLEDVKNGEVDLLVGTHSLLSNELEFKDLGLVVIDEEQRFGVSQRDKLSKETNVLYMTATPIARSMTLMYYSNMEVSRLLGKPTNDSVQVDTSLMRLSEVEKVLEGVKRKVQPQAAQGGMGGRDKVFWVLPWVGDKTTSQPLSDESTQEVELSVDGDTRTTLLTSVHYRYQTLVELLGEDRVRMVYGKMDTEAKTNALKEFSEGDVDVLVTTSLIEVGVHVPDATLCIVEHAERFGILQIHQFRGRIGRTPLRRAEAGAAADGEAAAAAVQTVRKCHCIMLYDDKSPSAEKAKERLLHLKRTNDGYEIAEMDAVQRGPGDMLGDRQSGYDSFRVANFKEHQHLVVDAYDVGQALAQHLVPMAGHFYNLDAKQEAVDTLLQIFGNKDETAPPPPPVKKPRAPRTKITAAERADGEEAVAASPSTPPRRQQQSAVVPAIRSPTSTLSDLEIRTPDEEGLKDGPSSVTISSDTDVSQWKPYGYMDLVRDDVVFIVFDTETTGLNFWSERIVQLGAKLYPSSLQDDTSAAVLEEEGDQANLFNAYVASDVPLSPKAAETNGLTDEYLAENGRPFQEVFGEFVQWVKDVGNGRPVVLVAHNADFDRKFLVSEAKRVGFTEQQLRDDLNILGVMCTYQMFKGSAIWSNGSDDRPSRPEKLKQETIYEHLYGKGMASAHSADGDVKGLVKILCHPHVRDRWRSLGSSYVYPIGDDQEEGKRGGRATRSKGAGTKAGMKMDSWTIGEAKEGGEKGKVERKKDSVTATDRGKKPSIVS